MQPPDSPCWLCWAAQGFINLCADYRQPLITGFVRILVIHARSGSSIGLFFG
jgi:hypothetical protein